MRNLNIKELHTHSGKVNISIIGETSFSIPEYAVILENGLCVETSMGLHLYGFAIAVTIYLAENHNGLLPVEINGCSTGEELFNTLKNLVDKDGIVSEDNSYEFMSLYMVTSSLDRVRAEDTWPELKSLISNTIFINSKYHKTESTKFGKTIAEKWIKKYGDLIWAIRVLSYMYTDEYFWDENEKSMWNEIVKEKVGVKLPTISHFKANHVSTTYENRFKLPGLIEKLFPIKMRNDVVNVIDNYATIREMYGAEASHGSFWLDNFTETDLDDIIFSEEPANDGPAITKTKEIEEMDSGTIIIKDNWMNVTIELNRKDILAISYSKSSDEGYLEFITPKDLLLKRLYKKGEVVPAYSIDEYSDVTILKGA